MGRWAFCILGGRMMANLKRMSIKVSEELYDFIANEAEREGLSMNAVIIFALNNYKKEQSVIPSLNNANALMELYQLHQQQERSK